MPRQNADDTEAALSRSSPRRKPPPSRSKSAAVVPDIHAPSRPVRPPFRLFGPFSARLHRFQPNGVQGSRSYLRRHGVQSRRAVVLYQNHVTHIKSQSSGDRPRISRGQTPHFRQGRRRKIAPSAKKVKNGGLSPVRPKPRRYWPKCAFRPF